MKYKVLVLADNSVLYATNNLTFDSIESAVEYAKDLYCRWTLMSDYVVVDSTLAPDNGSYYSECYAYTNQQFDEDTN